MTLSTDIIIVEPTDPKAVFDYCLSLLARGVDFEPQWDHTAAGEGRGFSTAHYASKCGQGLPAWLFVHYATDGPLTYYEPVEVEENQEDNPGWTPPPFNEHCIRIDFDTGYSYGRDGAGCSDLHAWLVQEVGRWLSERGITKWVWQQEFTGEWYGPDDPVDVLGNADKGALI